MKRKNEWSVIQKKELRLEVYKNVIKGIEQCYDNLHLDNLDYFYIYIYLDLDLSNLDLDNLN